jgi:integrase
LRETFYKEVKLQHADQPRTIEFYETNMRKIAEYAPLGRKDIDRIEAKDLSAYKHHLSEKEKLSPSTINRRLTTLRKALYMAKRLGMLIAVPDFEMLKEPRPREFVLQREDESVYLEACPQHLKDYVMLSLYTGMRSSECLACRREHITFSPRKAGMRPYIYVPGNKSDAARRHIPLPANLVAYLQEMFERGKSEWVLSSPRDVRRQASKDTLGDAHDRVKATLELPDEFVLHSLRHTYLTRLGESGADAWAIMRIAGHSSITMSQRYVHPTAGQVERAVELLELVG